MLRTFDDIVDDYIAHFRARRQREAFAVQKSLKDAIERGAMAVSPTGKRLSHQRRIPGLVLRAWADSLLERQSRIQQAQTFEQLYDVIAEAGSQQHGIGLLTVYDTATRIGTFLGREPVHV